MVPDEESAKAEPVPTNPLKPAQTSGLTAGALKMHEIDTSKLRSGGDSGNISALAGLSIYLPGRFGGLIKDDDSRERFHLHCLLRT